MASWASPREGWPRCETEGCDKNAWYNFHGGPARFCREHKEEWMVRALQLHAEGCSVPPTLTKLGVQQQEHVTNKTCEAEGCTTLASMGSPGQRQRFCKAHKLEGMVREQEQRTF